MEKEYWKNVIRSETPDGVIFIDERSGNSVHLLIDYPTPRQEVLCKAILDEAYWVLDNVGHKVSIKVELQ
jgi:hypothetical protein